MTAHLPSKALPQLRRMNMNILTDVAQGAKAAAGVSDTCRGDAVITMLANGYAVENVLIIVTTVWKRQQLGEELAQPCRALWQIDVSRLNLR